MNALSIAALTVIPILLIVAGFVAAILLERSDRVRREPLVVAPVRERRGLRRSRAA
jgi:hypothetical protein